MSEEVKQKFADWTATALRIVTAAMLAILAWLGQEMSGELKALSRDLVALKIGLTETANNRRHIDDHEQRIRALERRDWKPQ